MSKQKIAVGLSGGVDSAVSAKLLKDQGHDLTAVHLECWKQPGCRADQDRKDALQIALDLEIPFKTLDFRDEYNQQVMSYFLNEYQAGRTPNPDVLCNQVIKFGLFYRWAMQAGFDAIATGHYAQIGTITTVNQRSDIRLAPDEKILLSSRDLHKDQTYFLHQLKSDQLKQIRFPVGDLTKDQVRQTAQQFGLHVAQKKDSVGLCFVGEINVQEFLREKLGQNPGEVVNDQGQIIGRHQGLWFYTIGQRKGFEINKRLVKNRTDLLDNFADLPPLYVIDKEPRKNQLVVGLEPQTEHTQFDIQQLELVNPSIKWQSLPLLVRIRHTGKLIKCQVLAANTDKAGEDPDSTKSDNHRVNLEKSVKGVAAGQFAVFYALTSEVANQVRPQAKYTCIGGGVIV